MQENQSLIRVAYVIDKLALHGTQKSLIGLMQGLSQRRYQQRIYSLNSVVHPENRRALNDYGIEIESIGKWPILMLVGIGQILYDWLIWKPDIVFTSLFYSDFIGRMVAKLLSVPVIISSIRARNIYKNGVQLYIDRLTARWADNVVFNSKESIFFALQHEGIREEQVVYIPNGVSTSSRIQTDPIQKRQELGIASDALLIGSIGRLVSQKGYPCLLRAFQLIQKQCHNCRLFIIGQGPLLEELRDLSKTLHIADSVWFFGERTDIEELLACMNVYVQASLFEGMPNAVMEAMAVGKPVVATSVDGNLELIEDGITGWLVEPEKPEMLAEKVYDVLHHPELAVTVGAAAAQRIAQEFSMKKMVDAYDRLFRESLAKKQRHLDC